MLIHCVYILSIFTNLFYTLNLAQKILNSDNNQKQGLFFVALCVGIFILILSVMLYTDIYSVLMSKKNQMQMQSYMVINKNITNEMMGKDLAAFFTPKEIEELTQLESVDKIEPVLSNYFPLSASNIGSLMFSTDLFLEAVPTSFLDTQLENFSWQEGSLDVPVILSQDFLQLYNYGFALSQGLPQLSEETVKAIPFQLTIAHTVTYTAHIVGFTQRFTSIMVPEEFLKYANKNYGSRDYETPPGRLVLRCNEKNKSELISFLQQKNYTTQNEIVKWEKIKNTATLIFSISSTIGILLLILCIVSLLMYIKILILQHSAQLNIMHQIGYAKSTLKKYFIKKVLIQFTFTAIVAWLLCFLAKYLLQPFYNSLHIQTGYFSIVISLIVCASIICVFYFFINLSTDKQLQKSIV